MIRTGNPRRAGLMTCYPTFALVALVLVGCNRPSSTTNQIQDSHSPLEMMSVTWGLNLNFEQDFMRSFGERNGIETQYVPNTRLEVYQRLLKAHSKEPELLEIDIIWPSVLADDLIDLRPYVLDTQAFPQAILQNYTVGGKLVAVPVYIDVGVLLYRPELLAKYGFHDPPNTWDELETMAGRIQAGERRGGNKDFWGYMWQGAVSEGGACNMLEWQASSGAGNFIEAPGMVHVKSARFFHALQRASHWLGTISPPAEYAYQEDDSINVWNAGQSAFMRNWGSGYGHFAAQPGKDRQHFKVAPLPAGPGGHRGTLGGLGIGISKYAAHRDLAIKALLEMISEQNDLKRAYATGGIPARLAVSERADIKSRSLLLAVSADLMKGLVSRPALITGAKYEAVSHEYALAVNSVLRGKATPEAAMAELEQKLMKITGLPAQRD